MLSMSTNVAEGPQGEMCSDWPCQPNIRQQNNTRNPHDFRNSERFFFFIQRRDRYSRGKRAERKQQFYI